MSLKSSQEYSIAWIAALPIERSAATEMLDEEHLEPSDFPRHEADDNCYTWGRIAKHDIVIASLPAASYGTINAVSTALSLLASLPHIKLGLLVGIAAGLPNEDHDIRLGDVVVSQPDMHFGGVVQYDLSKSKANGKWELKGSLASPPKILLNAMANLQANHESRPPRYVEFLNSAMQKNAHWGLRFARPDGAQDRLFESSTLHVGVDCKDCGAAMHRSLRPSQEPYIHYGIIASGDTLVKDAKVRDDIRKRIGYPCLCLEMEAAGLMDSFPCLVIRGICDYADSHKNDVWQRYASAAAASYAKELLHYVPLRKISSLAIRAQFDAQKSTKLAEKLRQSLYTCPYTERKNRNPERLKGTCNWVLKHPLFRAWLDEETSSNGLLWISAGAGCGKSVLARYLVDDVLPALGHPVIYWFFNDDFSDQKHLSGMLCAFLHQIFLKYPEMISESDLKLFGERGPSWTGEVQNLMSIFERLISSAGIGKFICVIDALDECETSERNRLINWISSLFSTPDGQKSFRFIITSRQYGYIDDGFSELKQTCPTIHLDGDDDAASATISQEIELVITDRVQNLGRKKNWPLDVQDFLITRLKSAENRTYLWVHLTLEYLSNMPYRTASQLESAIGTLPQTVDAAYEKILNRSLDSNQTRLVLHLVMAATRPLTLYDMTWLLAVSTHDNGDSTIREVDSVSDCAYTIKNLCGLFLTIKDSVIYLLHQTAREFLVKKSKTNQLELSATSSSDQNYTKDNQQLIWKHSFSEVISNRIIAERCIWFLLLNMEGILKPRDCGSPCEFCKLWQYCSRNWYKHVARADFVSDEKATDQALLLCKRLDWDWESHATAFCCGSGTTAQFDRIRPIREKSSLITPAAFGLTCVVEYLLKHRYHNYKWASQALWLAAYNGATDTAIMLLDYGADPNVYPSSKLAGFSGSALSHAVRHGDTILVAALEKAGANA